jgi:NTP pyrophosphatase (non-canonical NTP hydrolase)
MALSVEVAEIVEILQWLTQEESRNLSPHKKDKVKEEIGDVLIFLANLADKSQYRSRRCCQGKAEDKPKEVSS